MSRLSGRAWAAMCALALVGCAGEPAEERLRASIAAAQHDLESRNGAALAERVADDFVGPGGMDRVALRRTAQAAFLRYRTVGVTVGPTQVGMSADGRHATVRFTAALTGSDGTVLPDSARLYQVESGWRRTGDDWELTSLRWDGAQ